jgi:hypothetical protein
MSILDYFGGLFGRLPMNYSGDEIANMQADSTMQQLNRQMFEYQRQQGLQMLMRDAKRAGEAHPRADIIDSSVHVSAMFDRAAAGKNPYRDGAIDTTAVDVVEPKALIGGGSDNS